MRRPSTSLLPTLPGSCLILLLLVGCSQGDYQKAFPREIVVDAQGNVAAMGYAIGGSRTSYQPGTNPYSTSSTYQYILTSSDGGTSWKNLMYEGCEAGLLMKVPSLGKLIFAGVGLGVFISPSTFTDSWVFTAELDLDSYGRADVIPYSGAQDPSSGRIYGIGSTYNSINGIDDRSHLLVWRAASPSAEWQMAHDYSYDTAVGSDTYARGVAVDSAGAVYVAAAGVKLVSGLNDYDWLVLKSTTGTSTLAVMDNFDLTAGTVTAVYGIAVDTSNAIYAVGTGNTTTGSQWLVRKSTNGGTSWTTIDSFALTPTDANSPSAVANGITIGANGAIYVVGESRVDSSHFAMIVRKSTNGGSSWTTVDQYTPEPYGTEARSVAVGPSGEVYVFSQYSPAGTSGSDAFRAVEVKIRKSTDAGSSWSEVYSGEIDTLKP